MLEILSIVAFQKKKLKKSDSPQDHKFVVKSPVSA